MKKISILTNLGRGDVQPYLALAVGLKEAGYSVTLAAPMMYENWIRSYGINYAPVHLDIPNVRDHPEIKKAEVNTLRLAMLIPKLMSTLFAELFDDLWAASQGADALVISQTSFGAYSIAEKLDVPYFMSSPFPWHPTGDHASLVLPTQMNFGKPLNRLSQSVFEQLFWQFVRSPVTKWRKKVLELPAMPFSGPTPLMRAQKAPHLFAFSSSVSPQPQDYPDYCHTTGYWYLDSPSDWRAPKELLNFLDAGPPPLAIGFGSMEPQSPKSINTTVIEALKKTNQRAVLVSQWGDLIEGKLPKNVFAIKDVPHDWLFPKMQAVIHHGGAGTTAAGLRAGVPSIIAPFGVDQIYWARTVVELGIGPRTPRMKKLNSESLASSIAEAVRNKVMVQKASKFGEKIKSETGVANAIKVIETQLSK